MRPLGHERCSQSDPWQVQGSGDARFFFCARPYYKPHRVGKEVYRGANAGDFAAAPRDDSETAHEPLASLRRLLQD